MFDLLYVLNYFHYKTDLFNVSIVSPGDENEISQMFLLLSCVSQFEKRSQRSLKLLKSRSKVGDLNLNSNFSHRMIFRHSTIGSDSGETSETTLQ